MRRVFFFSVELNKTNTMSVPSVFAYGSEKLSGYTTNYFKCLPSTGSAAVSPGQTTRFALPTASYINFPATRIYFNVETTGSDNSRLPASLDMLISRVSVYAGGVCISSQHNNYGLLCQAKTIFESDYQSVCHGHLDMVRSVPYQTIPKDTFGTTSSGGSTVSTQTKANATTISGKEVYPDRASGDTIFCLELKHTFLSTVQPPIVNAALMPELTVELQWESNNVLSACLGTALPLPGRIGTHEGQERVKKDTSLGSDFTQPHGTISSTYSVMDLSMMVQVCSLQSSLLQELEQRTIAERGFLSLIYKGYGDHGFSGGVSACQMQISSQSLDRLICCYHRNDRLVRGGAVGVAGYRMQGAFCEPASSGNGTRVDVGVASGQDTASTSHSLTSGERFLSRAQNLEFVPADQSVGFTSQVRLNGALLPSVPANVDEMYGISMNSVDFYKPNHTLRKQYVLNYACFVMSFCLPSDGYSARRISSGVDTRGLSSSVALLTTGLHETDQTVTIFDEKTMILRVSNGGQMQVIS